MVREWWKAVAAYIIFTNAHANIGNAVVRFMTMARDEFRAMGKRIGCIINSWSRMWRTLVARGLVVRFMERVLERVFIIVLRMFVVQYVNSLHQSFAIVAGFGKAPAPATFNRR